MSSAAVEWIRSIELPLALWLLGAAVLLPTAWRASRRLNRAAFVRLHTDESGAAYSLIYLMCFPAYAWIVCLVVQCTLIFMVKSGTMYAAYGAARSAVVWRTAKPENLRIKKIEQSAVQNMASFANYNAIPSLTAYPSTETLEYYAAYRMYIDAYNDPKYVKFDGPPEELFRRQWRYSERATKVKFLKAEDVSNGRVEVEVSHKMALAIPGIGWLLGSVAPWPDVQHRVYDVKSKMEMPSEAARTTDRTVGIDYRSNNR